MHHRGRGVLKPTKSLGRSLWTTRPGCQRAPKSLPTAGGTGRKDGVRQRDHRRVRPAHPERLRVRVRVP
jgi:hypothetical protein